MKEYKKEFIEFMVDCGVLQFGDFVTKSGRKTPFFINIVYISVPVPGADAMASWTLEKSPVPSCETTTS